MRLFLFARDVLASIFVDRFGSNRVCPKKPVVPFFRIVALLVASHQPSAAFVSCDTRAFSISRHPNESPWHVLYKFRSIVWRCLCKSLACSFRGILPVTRSRKQPPSPQDLASRPRSVSTQGMYSGAEWSGFALVDCSATSWLHRIPACAQFSPCSHGLSAPKSSSITPRTEKEQANPDDFEPRRPRAR